MGDAPLYQVPGLLHKLSVLATDVSMGMGALLKAQSGSYDLRPQLALTGELGSRPGAAGLTQITSASAGPLGFC